MLLFFIFLHLWILTKVVCYLSVAPLSEAMRVVEQLLGPYTGVEHAKRRRVVRESCLNRAYEDALFHLLERSNPDEAKKKRACVPEVEGTNSIVMTPLCAVGTFGAGGPSLAGEDGAVRPVKRVACGTPEWAGRSRVGSPFSAGRGFAPTGVLALEVC